MEYFVFYPKRLFVDAITIGNLVFIKRELKQDIALLNHELKHVEQFYRTKGLFWIQYLFSKKHRLKYEAEAFLVQTNGEVTDWMIDCLYNNYYLGFSKDYIKMVCEEIKNV